MQGLTIGDPPLSRTLGVALASGHVQVYLERGAPLPARRTFTHHTIETVAKGSSESVLRIPIVQGEMSQAHLCRLVGTLDIGGDAVKDTVPTGSAVEVTIELDRGGRLAARALVPVDRPGVRARRAPARARRRRPRRSTRRSAICAAS